MQGKSVPSEVYDSGATSIYRMNNNEFILTDERSNKLFHMPTGATTNESVKSTMHHDRRDPAITVDMVPSLKSSSSMSAGKLADTNYITVMTPE